MEYLMTYGWAILIIAVVLGALFQLGVFSGIGTPRAQAGNCQVIKAGSGITQTVSLAGECQGQEPEYVAQFNGAANMLGSFSGGLPVGPVTSVTLTAWIYDPTNSNIAALAAGSSTYGCTSHLYEAGLNSYSVNVISYHGCCNDYGSAPPSGGWNRADGKWHFIAVAYNSSMQMIAFAMDGNYQTDSWGSAANMIGGQTILLGQDACDHWYFTGSEADLQLYNTSLSPAELTALYQEGIGGAPIRPQNIVGWWPLNGNGNDYSGNNNNLENDGVTFSSSWTNGYTPP